MTVKKRVSRSKAYADSRGSLQPKVTPLYVWGDFDVPFLLLALALLGFGLVMLFSASYARRILFLRDGEIFTEILRGNASRRAFFPSSVKP